MKLHELLGAELPIIQAPMAGAQLSALAIAACNAGALGSLPCAMLAPEAIRKELAAIRAATDRPFNVNFFCHQPPAEDARREAAWRKASTRSSLRVSKRAGIGASSCRRTSARSSGRSRCCRRSCAR